MYNVLNWGGLNLSANLHGIVCILSRRAFSTIYIYRDCMVVGFTTTYAISTYHHSCCEFESWSVRGVQHYVIKFVSDLRQIGGFTGYSINKTDCHDIAEWVSERLLFNANSAIFQLYHGSNKLIFNEMLMMSALF
jgi:hypothetical protein